MAVDEHQSGIHARTRANVSGDLSLAAATPSNVTVSLWCRDVCSKVAFPAMNIGT